MILRMLLQFWMWMTNALANLVLQLHLSFVLLLLLVLNLLLVLLNSSLICQFSERVPAHSLIFHFAEGSLQLLVAIWRKWHHRCIRFSDCSSCYLDLRTERWQQIVVVCSITSTEV